MKHFFQKNMNNVARNREFSPLWGKVGFIAFLLPNLLVLAINMTKFMKYGQVLQKSI